MENPFLYVLFDFVSVLLVPFSFRSTTTLLLHVSDATSSLKVALSLDSQGTSLPIKLANAESNADGAVVLTIDMDKCTSANLFPFCSVFLNKTTRLSFSK